MNRIELSVGWSFLGGAFYSVVQPSELYEGSVVSYESQRLRALCMYSSSYAYPSEAFSPVMGFEW